MDSKVETKTPSSRRTKFVFVGLAAIICVLSYQLYSENKVKKQLVTRKSFYISKLFECRAASEKTETKYQAKKTEHERLVKQLSDKMNDYDTLSKKYSDIQDSFESQEASLSELKKSAEESKTEMSTLKDNYDSAVTSAKNMQKKLDETMRVCDEHKQKTDRLNLNASDRMKELETCQKEKANLEQEKQGLKASVQNLRQKIEEMGKRSASASQSASNVQQALAPRTNVVQPDLSTVGNVQHVGIGNIHEQPAQNSATGGQSSQNPPASQSSQNVYVSKSSQPADQAKITGQAESKTLISVTPSSKQPQAEATDVSKQTSASIVYDVI